MGWGGGGGGRQKTVPFACVWKRKANGSTQAISLPDDLFSVSSLTCVLVQVLLLLLTVASMQP